MQINTELHKKGTAHPVGHLPNTALTDRAELLQSLVPLWPAEALDLSIEGRLHVIRLLRRSLRSERARCRDYAADYSPRKHADLIRACRLEEAALLKQMRAEFAALSECTRHAA